GEPALSLSTEQAQLAERDVAVLAQLGPVLLHGARDGTEALLAQLVMSLPEPSFRLLETHGVALGVLRPAAERQPQRDRVGCGPPGASHPLELGRSRPAEFADRGDERRAVRLEMTGQRDCVIIGSN